jgi:hypothetical protein
MNMDVNLDGTALLWCLLLGCLLLGSTLLGCQDSLDGKRLPTENGLPHTDEVDRVVDGTSASGTEITDRYDTRIEQPRKGTPLLGNPYDVGVSSTVGGERIFVFDTEYSDFKVYDEKGRYEFSFGEPGAGPGRFQNVEGVAARKIDDGRQLTVVSRTRRIQVLAPARDTVYQREKSTPPFEPRDVCSTGEKTYVHGGYVGPEALDNEASIFQIDEDGTVENRFGPTYESDAWIVTYSMSEGVIGCDRHSDRVYFAFTKSGYIYSFSEAGKLAEVIKLEDFTSHRLVYADGGVKQRDVVGGNRIVDIVDSPGKGVVVQKRITKDISAANRPTYRFQRTFVSKDSVRKFPVSDEILLGLSDAWAVTVPLRELSTLAIWRKE